MIEHHKINSSGMYKLQCKSYNKSYIGWAGRSIEIRHREHISYIKTNNPISAYALHILNNRHEYGNAEHTMQLIKICNKGKVMNCWKSFYMQMLQQQKLLIDEQKTNERNPLYALASFMKHVTQPGTYSNKVPTRPAQE
jgi:hypothetical protein